MELKTVAELTTLPTFGKEFYVSVELKVEQHMEKEWGEVINLSNCPEEKNHRSCRAFIIFVDKRKQLFVTVVAGKTFEKIPKDKWIKVEAEQTKAEDGKVCIITGS